MNTYITETDDALGSLCIHQAGNVQRDPVAEPVAG
jgi:hypothetical protein